MGGASPYRPSLGVLPRLYPLGNASKEDRKLLDPKRQVCNNFILFALAIYIFQELSGISWVTTCLSILLHAVRVNQGKIVMNCSIYISHDRPATGINIMQEQ